MIFWNTDAGIIGTVTKGTAFSITLSATTGTSIVTVSLIAGSLPEGLSLSRFTISGTVPLTIASGLYEFTLRMASGAIVVDRTFSIEVTTATLVNYLPNANLGIWPDGFPLSISIAPTENIPELVGNIVVSSGTLPSNLVLDNSSGIISGIPNPSLLYITTAEYTNMESGKPDLHGSANSVTYNFKVDYTSTVNANYYITIARWDLSNVTSDGSAISYLYADYQSPSGEVDGVNMTFYLPNTPQPADSAFLYVNGILLAQGHDYTLIDNCVTFTTPPDVGSIIIMFYSYIDPSSGGLSVL